MNRTKNPTENEMVEVRDVENANSLSYGDCAPHKARWLYIYQTVSLWIKREIILDILFLVLSISHVGSTVQSRIP